MLLIDTPGFNDTFRSETEVLKEIASWLEKTYRNADIKLSGVLYLHALEERRMGGTSLRSLKMFRQLCGEASLSNVIMVSTGWGVYQRDGRVSTAEGKEQELMTKKEFWQGMIEKGAKTARFEDSQKSALDIISHLIPKAPVVLKIQHELVDEAKDLIDTAAGATVDEELVKLQAAYDKQLKDVQEEMTAALQDRDEEMQAILAEERLRFQKLRDEARRAQDSLKYTQRNAQRKHENEMEDMRHALGTHLKQAQADSELDRRAKVQVEAQAIADRMKFDQIVQKMEANLSKLRNEERVAIEAEIENAKKKQKTKHGAVKLLCNIVGVAGTITLSVLGFGILNPFGSLM